MSVKDHINNNTKIGEDLLKKAIKMKIYEE